MEASEPVQPPPPPPPPSETPPPATATAGEYPVRFEAERQEEYNRFLPLIKWLIALPHYIVLLFLGIGALFAIIIAFFAVLITGRYPRGLWDYVTGVHRWGMRVAAYVLLLRDEYPPFSLEDDPAYPVTVEWDYPETIDRWRPLVHWLLVIPYALVAGVLAGLAQIVAFIGVFVILFTKELPEGMFKLIVNPLRWQVRANSYGAWLVTRYPPFEWE
jgi:Domain of unknown function (DUF4389)